MFEYCLYRFYVRDVELWRDVGEAERAGDPLALRHRLQHHLRLGQGRAGPRAPQGSRIQVRRNVSARLYCMYYLIMYKSANIIAETTQ